MQLSRYTLIRKLHNSENYFILNPLTKQADIISPNEMDNITEGGYDEAILRSKGYILTQEEEDKLYKKAYFNFIDMRDASEIQIFLFHGTLPTLPAPTVIYQAMNIILG